MFAILYTLVLTHITMMFVVVYIHRGISHATIQFSPVFDHFIRLWLWLTDGVNIRDWAITHRLHHAHTDQPGDPHSPYLEGIVKIAWTNLLYTLVHRYRANYSQWTINHYGQGITCDWMETHVYQPYQRLGVFVMLTINILLFGFGVGLGIWLVQMIWTPFWTNSIVTGFCHWRIGYPHPDSQDRSKNLPFLGLFLIGDELHSNHHARPMDPCLRKYWWEFDLGWVYIRLFERLRLLTIL